MNQDLEIMMLVLRCHFVFTDTSNRSGQSLAPGLKANKDQVSSQWSQGNTLEHDHQLQHCLDLNIPHLLFASMISFPVQG